jgi:hypothetical protein
MLLLAVLIPIIYVLPGGFIYAMTGQGVRTHYIHFAKSMQMLTSTIDHCEHTKPNRPGDAVAR